MAVSILQTVSASAASGASVLLPSWTVNAGELVLVWVAEREELATITVSGHGLTWDHPVNLDNTQGESGIDLFRAEVAAGATGQITVTQSLTTKPLVVMAARISGQELGLNGGSALTLASNAGPAAGNDDMLSSVTTVADNSLALAFGTYTNKTFTVPGGETGLIVNTVVVAGADTLTASLWQETALISPAGSVQLGALNDLSSPTSWCMVLVAVKPVQAPVVPPSPILTGAPVFGARVYNQMDVLTASSIEVSAAGHPLSTVVPSPRPAGLIRIRRSVCALHVVNPVGQGFLERPHKVVVSLMRTSDNTLIGFANLAITPSPAAQQAAPWEITQEFNFSPDGFDLAAGDTLTINTAAFSVEGASYLVRSSIDIWWS